MQTGSMHTCATPMKTAGVWVTPRQALRLRPQGKGPGSMEASASQAPQATARPPTGAWPWPH